MTIVVTVSINIIEHYLTFMGAYKVQFGINIKAIL